MGFFRRRTATNQAPDTAKSPASSPAPSPTPASTAASQSPFASTQELDQQLPGVALHYQTWGAPNPERAVILIHGLTANHKCWALLGPHLADAGYFVIAPDLRGRGLSGKPPQGYGVAIHAYGGAVTNSGVSTMPSARNWDSMVSMAGSGST